MGEEKNSSSWWTTLPGLITAVATLLTAVGGLVAILNTAHFFDKTKTSEEKKEQTQTSVSEHPTVKQNDRNLPRSPEALQQCQQVNGGIYHACMGDVLVVYNSANGAADVKHIDTAGNVTLLKTHGLDYFGRDWTNLAGTPNGIMFYNRPTGETSIVTCDNSGECTTLQNYKDKSKPFVPGWTSSVSTPNGILLYNQETGDAAVVRVEEGGSVNLMRSYPSGQSNSFSPGWNSIVFTERGIEYYNDGKNQHAIGTLDEHGNHRTVG